MIKMLNDFLDYNREGLLWTTGFEPRRMRADGTMGYVGYNAYLERGPGTNVPQPMHSMRATGWKKWGSIGAGVAGLGFSAFNLASGFSEGGLAGLKDAAVWEMATGAAAARFSYGSLGTSGAGSGSMLARMTGVNVGIKNAGTKIAFGGGGSKMLGMARVGGAGVGATIGQSLLGTPGAFLGAYIGAAPIRFAATHPLLAGGMVAGAAAAAVGYGAYQATGTLLRAGYQHRQRQRGIDTSGSMAAFMTAGAQTMRARAVQAIHKSHMNARSALGQEASFMHMPGKNYHSRYR